MAFIADSAWVDHMLSLFLQWRWCEFAASHQPSVFVVVLNMKRQMLGAAEAFDASLADDVRFGAGGAQVLVAFVHD